MRCGCDVHSESQGDGGGHTSDGGAGAQGGGAGNGGDQCTWVKPARCQRFLFPVQALSKVFRGKFFDACPGSGLASCLLLAVPGAGVTAAAQTLLLASQPPKPTRTSARASCHPAQPAAPQSKRPHPGGCIKAPDERLVRFEAAGLSSVRTGASNMVVARTASPSTAKQVPAPPRSCEPVGTSRAPGASCRPPGANSGLGFASIRLLDQPSRRRLNRPGVHRVQPREDADLFG